MFASRHHPDGGAGDVDTLATIVDLAQPRALTLIRFYRTTKYRPRDELLSDVNFKLMRAVDKFDPSKGSAFTFISQVISNTLSTSVTCARRNLARHRRLTKVDLKSLTTNREVESGHAIDDLTDRVRRGVRTTVTDPDELGMQRWYVESFIDGAFELRRHQCGDAAMMVHGVSHSRSRELYDLTLLAIRQVMFDILSPRQPIIAHRLYGTRLAWRRGTPH
jgi:hypothetical protein